MVVAVVITWLLITTTTRMKWWWSLLYLFVCLFIYLFICQLQPKSRHTNKSEPRTKHQTKL